MGTGPHVARRIGELTRELPLEELDEGAGVVADDRVRPLIALRGERPEGDRDAAGRELRERLVEVLDEHADLEDAVGARGVPTGAVARRGVVAAEVQLAVISSGEPLPNPDGPWPITRFVTKSISEIASDPAEAGKTLVARSRWIGTTGQVGPWGPVETGTIAA